MNANNHLSILFILLSLVGCKYKVETNMTSEEFKREAESREIKRLKESEIIDAAYLSGKQIADSLSFSYLNAKNRCGESIQRGKDNQSNALKSMQIVCSEQETSLEKEKEIWNAYQYNFEHGQEMRDNIQPLDEQGQLLFTRPLVSKDDSSQFIMISILLDKKEIILGL